MMDQVQDYLRRFQGGLIDERVFYDGICRVVTDYEEEGDGEIKLSTALVVMSGMKVADIEVRWGSIWFEGNGNSCVLTIEECA